MAPKRIFTAEETAYACERYNRLASTPDIAKELACAHSTVNKLLRANGIVPKSGPRVSAKMKGRPKTYMSKRAIPIAAGIRFGRLVTMQPYPRLPATPLVLCHCDCGNTKSVPAGRLRHGDAKSCGCLNDEQRLIHLSVHRWKHGELFGRKDKQTPEYKAWGSMKRRCNNPNSTAYKWYGARGIKVCPRWQTSFRNFLADMGRKPSPKLTLDRINNDGNYEPGNCRWVTAKEQGRNTRVNRRFTYKHESLTVPEWSERTGIKTMTLRRRLLAGWPIEKALTKPAVIGANGS